MELGSSRSNWTQKPGKLQPKLWPQGDSGTCLMVLFCTKRPMFLLRWVRGSCHFEQWLWNWRRELSCIALVKWNALAKNSGAREASCHPAVTGSCPALGDTFLAIFFPPAIISATLCYSQCTDKYSPQYGRWLFLLYFMTNIPFDPLPHLSQPRS